MTQDVSPGVPNLDALGFDLPTPEQGLVEAKRRFALTLRRSELAWLLHEQYDPSTPAWNIDVARNLVTLRDGVDQFVAPVRRVRVEQAHPEVALDLLNFAKKNGQCWAICRVHWLTGAGLR